MQLFGQSAQHGAPYGRSTCRIASLGVLLAVLGVAVPPALARNVGHRRAERPFTSYVDPFVGSAGGGNTFPGPVMPGGMIQLGPDTVAHRSAPAGALQPSGYDYGSAQLRGFSLDRMSGAGCAEFEDVPITPTTAPITASPVSDPTSGNLDSSYFLSFSHRQELARPGYYSVVLDESSGRGPITAQLTTATRSAIARFSFPSGAATSSVID